MIFKDCFYSQEIKFPQFFRLNENDVIDCHEASSNEEFEPDLSSVYNKLKEINISINEKNGPLYNKFVVEAKNSKRFEQLKHNLTNANTIFEKKNVKNLNVFSKIYLIVANFFRALLRLDPISLAKYPTFKWDACIIQFPKSKKSENNTNGVRDNEMIVKICEKASQVLSASPVQFKVQLNDEVTKKVIVTPDKKILIEQEFIAKGTSKKIFRLEVYDLAGNKQNEDLAKYISEEEVHIQEVHNERDISDDVNSPFVNQLVKVLDYNTKNNKMKVIFLSPLYEGTLTRMQGASFVEKLTVAIDVTKGVQDLHKKDYIHCDLHFGNLFVKGNRGVVGDLGAAKRVSEKCGLSTIPVSTEDNIYGMILSPECSSSGKPQSKASDVYALGMIFRGLFKDADHPLAKELRTFAEYGKDPHLSPLGGMQAREPNFRPTIENVLSKLQDLKNNVVSN